MDIEAVAKESPESIMSIPIDVTVGLNKEQASTVAKKLGFHDSGLDEAADILQKLYQVFISNDSSMIEINPMIEDASGHVYCLDAKCRFDDSASFRHKDLFARKDWSQVNEKEREAAKSNLNYIALDGDIGCLVNGAGLAMATMDIIKLHGGSPANFLDVGGGATSEQVKEGNLFSPMANFKLTLLSFLQHFG